MPSHSTTRTEDRVNVNDDYELRPWADKFGVDIERPRDAVRRVGDRADAVEQYQKHFP